MQQANDTDKPTRKRPSRLWYLLSMAVLLTSGGVFVGALINQGSVIRDRIEAMPRFVGPTDSAAGVVIELDTPGKHSIFYENRGSLDGRLFDTPRYQVWTDPHTPSMTLRITDTQTQEERAARIPEVGGKQNKTEVTKDQVFPYDYPDRQGSGVWVFEVDEPGTYRFDVSYLESVGMSPGEVVIPPELTKADKKEMTSEQGAKYEAERREAIKQAALAELEPVEVLFAVGPADPTRGSFFNVIGLKGAATVFAFGFTFAALTALVTLMLRGGHVTPRGELSKARPILHTPNR